MVPHANWHHPKSEHTKYSTYQQQCTGSKCSLWGMKMATTTKLVEFSFYPRPVWPSGIVVACVCLCVCPCVCVNSQLVRVITDHLFELGSLNLDHRCKRPCLRSLMFFFFLGGGGWLTLTFKVKFNFKVKSYPVLSLSARWLITCSSYDHQIWAKGAKYLG